jgi:hypothetical protein
MTPQQKALQLIEKFENYSFMDIDKRISSFNSAKQCALIAVDEMIVLIGEIAHTADEYYLNRNELLEIKQEIENL